MVAGKSFPVKAFSEPHAVVWRYRLEVLPALFKQPGTFSEGDGEMTCA